MFQDTTATNDTRGLPGPPLTDISGGPNPCDASRGTDTQGPGPARPTRPRPSGTGAEGEKEAAGTRTYREPGF